jgi:hypothetical protein
VLQEPHQQRHRRRGDPKSSSHARPTTSSS